MALKAFLSVAAVAAIAIGLMLPVPGGDRQEPRSRIATLQLGAG